MWSFVGDRVRSLTTVPPDRESIIRQLEARLHGDRLHGCFISNRRVRTVPTVVQGRRSIRTRHRRRLEVSGEPSESRLCEWLTDDQERLLSIVDILRLGRRRVAAPKAPAGIATDIGYNRQLDTGPAWFYSKVVMSAERVSISMMAVTRTRSRSHSSGCRERFSRVCDGTRALGRRNGEARSEGKKCAEPSCLLLSIRNRRIMLQSLFVQPLSR